MSKIIDPGIYYDFPVEVYFRDPCPTPSLTQSLVKVLIEQSPLHAWCSSPRLNARFEIDDEKKFDIGNVAHRLLLGRGRDIVVVDAPDWRTKLAQAERKAAIDDGKLPVLLKQMERARAMVDAVRHQLDERGIISAFVNGHGEVVAAASDNGVWLRTMIDWMVHTEDFWDYKTTDFSVAPHALGNVAANAGYDIQAAMQERILDIIDPNGAGLRKFRFVVQETEEPYALSVIEMTEEWLTMGRKKVQHAFDIWADCLKANRWPAYPTDILKLEYPGWKETRWLEREIAHEVTRARSFDPNVLMAG